MDQYWRNMTANEARKMRKVSGSWRKALENARACIAFWRAYGKHPSALWADMVASFSRQKP